jgi:acetylornithine deacetylase
MAVTTRRYSPRQMIERLVGFDTTSAKSNLQLIDFVDAYLRDLGVSSRRTGEAGKANLFATIGPEIAGGVVLSGHSDVVPVDGQAWSHDPFEVSERDGRLYGRGTADMKSFLAVALAMVPDFLSAPLKVPLHLAISYDEEVGCLGVAKLIDDIKAALPLPRMVIIGEPTSMQIVNAHKSVTALSTTITGKPAHSSQPHRGASAILAAGRLIHHIGEMAASRRDAAPADSLFEPPYTTFNVGVVEGGAALNIILQHCAFTWEFRALPEEDPETILADFERFTAEAVLPQLREFDPTAGIVTQVVAEVTALRPEAEGAAEALLRSLSGNNRTAVVSFGTEGGLFQQAGFSTVVFGPGSIDQAHQPDEFIALRQVAACEEFLFKLRDWARV